MWNVVHYKNKHIKITSAADNIGLNVEITPKKNRGHYKSSSSNLFDRIFKRGYSNKITPLELNDTKAELFATMDIETMEINGIQMPIAISTAYYSNKLNAKLFLINP